MNEEITREKSILEKFVDEYGAKRTTERDDLPNPSTEVYIDPDCVVIVGDEFVGRVIDNDESNYTDEFAEWEQRDYVTKDDEEIQLWYGRVGGTWHTYKPEYVELVAELFDVDPSNLTEHARSKKSLGVSGWPMVVDDPDSDLQAMISPFIRSD